MVEDTLIPVATESTAIILSAHVTELLPHGGRRVRLVNGHELDVLPADPREPGATLVGDIVSVALAPNQLRGWRMIKTEQ